MSRRKAIESKRLKEFLTGPDPIRHALVEALRDLRDEPWPAPGSYKDACGLSMGEALELQLRTVLLPATATSARLNR